jgi:hypothetical protein
MKSLFKRRRPATLDAVTADGTLKGNKDAQAAPATSLMDELFSTAGDYGLQTLSENTDDIVE